MRYFVVLVSIMSLASCSLLQREAGYPGGNLGFLADRHALFARGHEQRVNRFIVTLSLTAPFIAETAQSSSEAKLTSAAIDELYATILALKEAQPVCRPELNNEGTAVQVSNCSAEMIAGNGATALDFERLAFTVNKSLYDALKQGFDNLELKANVKKILALEPIELLRTILRARHLVPVLVEYLATYRDVTVIFGQSVVTSCVVPVGQASAARAGIESLQRVKQRTELQNEDLQAFKSTLTPSLSALASACGKVDEKFVELIDRSRTADFDVARQERPLRDVYLASSEAINAGLNWKLEEWQVAALLHKVNRACLKLEARARVDDEDFDGCGIKWESSVAGAEKVSGVQPSAKDQETASNVRNLIAKYSVDPAAQ